MEQDTGGHSLVSTADNDTLSRAFSLSDSDLLGLQNGSAEVLGDGANPDATSNHLSQGDLEALASIQEELDRMGTASSQASFVEGIHKKNHWFEFLLFITKTEKVGVCLSSEPSFLY